MVRGFPAPPAVHLVHREPLQADDLDRQVIRGMKGFEFGTENEDSSTSWNRKVTFGPSSIGNENET